MSPKGKSEYQPRNSGKSRIAINLNSQFEKQLHSIEKRLFKTKKSYKIPKLNTNIRRSRSLTENISNSSPLLTSEVQYKKYFEAVGVEKSIFSSHYGLSESSSDSEKSTPLMEEVKEAETWGDYFFCGCCDGEEPCFSDDEEDDGNREKIDKAKFTSERTSVAKIESITEAIKAMSLKTIANPTTSTHFEHINDLNIPAVDLVQMMIPQMSL